MEQWKNVDTSTGLVLHEVVPFSISLRLKIGEIALIGRIFFPRKR